MNWEMMFKIMIFIMFLLANIIIVMQAITLLYYEKRNEKHFENLIEEFLKEGDWRIK